METPKNPCPSARSEEFKGHDGSHILIELRSHDDLLLPVRGSKRLKYTCIACSRRYIALGSSHGGLYVFQRDTLKYLQQIGNKDGLTKAAFSPNENVIGMATSGGGVIIWKLNMTSRSKAERLVATLPHKARQVTSLCWDGAGLKLYSADDQGRIAVTNADSKKASGLFKLQSEHVLDVDSGVVQMSFGEERLLVSTMTKCYLLEPKKKLSFPIGSKSRDGAYGACFMKKPGSEKPTLFCARPGSRMWEANFICQVLSTHQFKQLLATPPLPVMGKGREAQLPSEDAKHPPQSMAFPVLHPLGHHFLVTWNEKGVFLFDPVHVKVVFWTRDITDLVSVCVSKSSLYCLHGDSRIRKYTLQDIPRCVSSLYQQNLLAQCSRLLLRFPSQIQRSRARHHLPVHLLHELGRKVAEQDSTLGCGVEDLAAEIENRFVDGVSTVSSRRSSFDSYDGMRTQSGIYVVRKRLDSTDSLEDLPLGYDAHMDQWEVAQAPKSNMEYISKETILEASPTHSRKDVASDKEDAQGAIGGTTDLTKPGAASVTEVPTLHEGNASPRFERDGLFKSKEDYNLPLDRNSEAENSSIVTKGTEIAQNEDRLSGNVAQSEHGASSIKKPNDLSMAVKVDNLSEDAVVVGTDHMDEQPLDSLVEGTGTLVTNTDNGNQTSNQTAETIDSPIEDTTHVGHTLPNTAKKLDVKLSVGQNIVESIRDDSAMTERSELETKDDSSLLSQTSELTPSSAVDEVDGGKEVQLPENRTQNESEGDSIMEQDQSLTESMIEDQTKDSRTRTSLDSPIEQNRRHLHNNENNHEETALSSSSSSHTDTVLNVADGESLSITPHQTFQLQDSRNVEDAVEASVTLVENSVAADFATTMVEMGKDDNMNLADESKIQNMMDGTSKDKSVDVTQVESVVAGNTANPAEDITLSLDLSDPVSNEGDSVGLLSVADQKVGVAEDNLKSTDTSGFQIDVTGFGIDTAEQEVSTAESFVENGSLTASDDPSGFQEAVVQDKMVEDANVEERDSSEGMALNYGKLTQEDKVMAPESARAVEVVASGGSSSQPLEIVKEDDLEVAEADLDAPFPDAKSGITQITLETVESQTAPIEKKGGAASVPKEESVIQTSSGGNSGSEAGAGKRKKTKSRIVDITATATKRPSHLPITSSTSVLFRNNSMPDLQAPHPNTHPYPSPNSSTHTHPSPITSTSPSHTNQSATTPPRRSSLASPSQTPKRDPLTRQSSSSSSFMYTPSPAQMVMAATSGLPQAVGLLESQQMIANSAAHLSSQINLKAVKNSLTSKLSKTKTFLQSMSDSNPLSMRDSSPDRPPLQTRPPMMSSPTNHSPVHTRGVPQSGGLSPQHSTYPIGQHRTQSASDSGGFPNDGRGESPRNSNGDFPLSQKWEFTVEDEAHSKLNEELIDATKNAVSTLAVPSIAYNVQSVRETLHPWVGILETTYKGHKAEGTRERTNGLHLQAAIRDDVRRLATLCISLDIYANEEEEGEGGTGENVEAESSPSANPGKIDQQRAEFIGRHFSLLDSNRTLEALRHKPGSACCAVSDLVECETAEAKGSSISEALDLGDAQKAFDLLQNADLSTNNLPLLLGYLKRLCSLDCALALDLMVKDYPHITPWHAWHVLQTQAESKRLILTYVETFLDAQPLCERNTFMEEVCKTEGLVLRLAEAALTSDPPHPRDLLCGCGKLPRPGSHLVPWSHDQVLQLLLKYPSIHSTSFLPLLKKAGYWSGILAIMQKDPSLRMDAIKICLQLGDLNLLQNILPSSEKEWETVLSWTTKLLPASTSDKSSIKRFCINCGNSLVPCTLQSLDLTIEDPNATLTSQVEDFSQPECDWSVAESSEQVNQSGVAMDRISSEDAHGTEIIQSESLLGSGKALGSVSSQSESLLYSRRNQSIMSLDEVNEKRMIHDPNASETESDWLPTVTWQKVALLLVRKLGALNGVKLLRDVNIPEGALGRGFHQLCIMSSLWKKQQSVLSHAMLEGTDTYLWSKRQPLLGPRLQHAVAKEYLPIKEGKAEIRSSEEEKVSAMKKLLSRNQLYIEDPATHWGRNINLARPCAVCQKPLARNLHLHSSGCLIFPCGHSFHTTCLPERACIVCFYSRKK